MDSENSSALIAYEKRIENYRNSFDNRVMNIVILVIVEVLNIMFTILFSMLEWPELEGVCLLLTFILSTVFIFLLADTVFSLIPKRLQATEEMIRVMFEEKGKLA